MSENSKQYDLEDRAESFARQGMAFIRKLPKSIANIEDGKPVVRSSGSVGANYIEANESLRKKDFRMRLKISRKEAKESRYRVRLIDTAGDSSPENERKELLQESTEFLNTLSAILNKSK